MTIPPRCDRNGHDQNRILRENSSYHAKTNQWSRLRRSLSIPSFACAQGVKAPKARQGAASAIPPGKPGPASASAGVTVSRGSPAFERLSESLLGGDPGRDFGPPKPATSVDGSPIGRDGLAGSRKDTPGNRVGNHRVVGATNPEGALALARASSGFRVLSAVPHPPRENY